MKDQKGVTLIVLILMFVIIVLAIFLGIHFFSGKGGFGGGNYSQEQLLEFYAKGIENQDYDMFIKAFAESIRENIAYYELGGREGFARLCQEVTEQYGSGVTITLNVTNKVEEPQTWLEQNEQYLRRDLNSNAKLTKAYRLEGTVTFSGSRNTETRDIEELWYCEVDGKWGLIGG